MDLEQWAVEHPGLALPIILAAVVLFVPKSEETLAKLPPWLAGFLRVTAALSPDLREAWGVYRETRARAALRKLEPPSSRGFAFTDVMAAIATFAIVALGIMTSCGPAQLTPAEGDRLLDHAGTLRACEDVGRDAGSMRAYDACLADAGVRR